MAQPQHASKSQPTQCGAIGGNVYIRSEEYGWVPASVMSPPKDGKLKVAIPQYQAEEFILSDGGKAAIGFQMAEIKLEDYPHQTLPPAGSDGMEVHDLVDLPLVHEAAMLYHLKSRHRNGHLYHRIGSLDVLVAVNPYQWFSELYDNQVKQQYANTIVWETQPNDSDPRTSLPPHVYEVTALSFRDLVTKQENQSILLCGESGAGKTETAKLCLHHLAFLQKEGKSHDDTNEESSLMIRRILDSNQLLEVFGNAKTSRNDNSSRFGRYTTLQFQRFLSQDGELLPQAKLVGSEVEVFFLEKNRAVHHNQGEYSFQVFYQLLTAPNEEKEKIWEGLVGKSAESFKYLGESPKIVEYGTEPVVPFQTVKDALTRLGIVDELYLTLLRAIAACLQLGNLDFLPDESNEEKAVIASKQEFASFCELIGCDEQLMEGALTKRLMKTRNEEYMVDLNPQRAKETADVFAKEIYAKIFQWLVRSINGITNTKTHESDYGWISILDFFGFESLPTNGFEQLCINYCDEKLQSKFIKDIFVSVAKEYEAEGVDLADDISYDDNSDVMDLLEGKCGLISMLSEECIRPKGQDSCFVQLGVYGANKKNPSLIGRSPKEGIDGLLFFGIRHYAGNVDYSAQDFVLRNGDQLPNDIIIAAESCANEILSKDFRTILPTKVAPVTSRRAPHTPRCVPLMTQLSSQLKRLVSRLETTKSRYIRCINPNTEKKPFVMQHKTTLNQLRAACVNPAIIQAQRLERDNEEWELF